QESRISQSLKPFGIGQIRLNGEGLRWIDPRTRKILAERFYLEGFVEQEGAQIPWRIDFARAIREGA
ncbi:MAG: hypothetical protein HY609_05435, partial [Deltaproteobacteria bacterium]|nr:hypothetical protein [Deltaproteobacteria bacterium]